MLKKQYKLSDETIAVMQSFRLIHSGVFFKSGSDILSSIKKVGVQSGTPSLFARFDGCTVFDTNVSIGDVGEFMRAYASLDEPTLEIAEQTRVVNGVQYPIAPTMMTMIDKGNKRKIKYRFANEAVHHRLVLDQKDIPFENPDVVLELKWLDIHFLLKQARGFGLTAITIKSDGVSPIRLTASNFDAKDAQDIVSVEVDATSEKQFELSLSIDNFDKLFQGDYDVKLKKLATSGIIAAFFHKSMKLKYIMGALNEHSKL